MVSSWRNDICYLHCFKHRGWNSISWHNHKKNDKMKKGDLVHVVAGDPDFIGMVGIITNTYIESKFRHRKGELVVEFLETHDLGGDTYSFYHDSLEVISETKG